MSCAFAAVAAADLGQRLRPVTAIDRWRPLWTAAWGSSGTAGENEGASNLAAMVNSPGDGRGLSRVITGLVGNLHGSAVCRGGCKNRRVSARGRLLRTPPARRAHRGVCRSAFATGPDQRLLRVLIDDRTAGTDAFEFLIQLCGRAGVHVVSGGCLEFRGTFGDGPMITRLRSLTPSRQCLPGVRPGSAPSPGVNAAVVSRGADREWWSRSAGTSRRRRRRPAAPDQVAIVRGLPTSRGPFPVQAHRPTGHDRPPR